MRSNKYLHPQQICASERADKAALGRSDMAQRHFLDTHWTIRSVALSLAPSCRNSEHGPFNAWRLVRL